jgi:hypothetical protein
MNWTDTMHSYILFITHMASYTFVDYISTADSQVNIHHFSRLSSDGQEKTPR